MKLLSGAGSFAVSAAGGAGEGWAQGLGEVVRELPARGPGPAFGLSFS